MQIEQTPSFKKNLKKLKNKHVPINELFKPCLKAIIEQDNIILKKIKDHALKGKWQGYREFHPSRVSNDYNDDGLICIYKIDKNELILLLVTVGSHKKLN